MKDRKVNRFFKKWILFHREASLLLFPKGKVPLFEKKLMKKQIFILLCIVGLFNLNGIAQRKYQTLDRGVVAVNDGLASGSKVFVSWRLLAQDPDSIRFNLYCMAGGSGEYTLMNSNGPLFETNFSTTLSKVPNNSLLCVAPVLNGSEGAKSLPFRFIHQTYRSVFLQLNFDGFLSNTDYSTKFIWPADLDGDGEYDYVVDRLSLSGQTHKVEAYLKTGLRLWTIDMGPNVRISEGHNDMVLAYDMNCDGKAEVVIKSSDGTRFWDKKGKTWGSYLKGTVNGDTDNDGIVDYTSQSVRVPPQYITVVDGMTGTEISTIEMPYPNDAYNQYTRDSKSNYMDVEYSNLSGHMGVAYLDGVHPSVVMEYMCRYKKISNDPRSEFHFYYVSAWGYNFVNGKATDWAQKYTWNRNFQNAAEFHHLRIGDVDFDGKDEMLEGGYTIDDNGTLLFSAHISHGDRFRVGDINPERPGLETFAIQQSAADMLGQILYDSETGEAIKKWYLAGVGDVGRGECIDIDKQYKGYEMWSTMGNIYNAQGDIIYKGSVDMPKEGMWWDGELDREILDAKDGNGANAMIVKYAGNGSYQNNRLIQFAQMMNWSVRAEYGCRPAFFGDIIGDWREEVLLEKGDNTGFYGFTTDYPTGVRLYCLSENPMYRMQETTKGYYQSPYPDYYLGYDMPNPPLPPMMKTDLVWKSGSVWDSQSTSFTGYDEAESLPFKNGQSVLFDISGDNSDTIRLDGTLEPGMLYAMPPRQHNYTFGGKGTLSGEMELWKSQNGRLILNGDHTYTGKTVISEGTLELNGSLQSKVYIKAKGTLAGNALLDENIDVEAGLNEEGGRFSPGTDSAPYGKIQINSDLVLGGGVFIEMNLQTLLPGTETAATASDSMVINGQLTLSGINTLNIKTSEEKPLAGRYPLVFWKGPLNGGLDNLKIDGLKGMSTELEIADSILYLIIKGQREAQTGVHWTGKISGNWDFNTDNFELSGQPVRFVNGDQLLFDDNASQKTVVLTEYLETKGIVVDNSEGDYTFTGTSGGITGTGGITKTGSSALRLLATKSDYTGATKIENGLLEVTELADGGKPSSIGAASADASNLVLTKASLRINNANTASNRGLTLHDTCTIEISQNSSYATLKGLITGDGRVVKTGPGQLSMTYDGANTYTGGTAVKAGTLAMGTWRSTFGKLGSPLEVSGVSTVSVFNNNSTSAVPVFDYAMVVPTGSNIKFNTGQRCKIRGTLSGGGSITMNVPYVRTDLTGNWSAFEGNLYVTGNQFRLCNSNGLQNAYINLGDNVAMGHFIEGSANALSGTSKIGGLGGSSSSNLYNGTYLVGYNNKNATFNGVINAGVTIAKYGTGTWTLSNANLMTSTVNIFAGTLYLINTSGSATGSGPVNIKTEAILNGTGSVAGAVTVESGGTLTGSLTIGGLTTVKNGGTLVVGSAGASTAKTITIKNALILDAGSNLKMKLFADQTLNCDQLIISKVFTPGGTLTLSSASSGTFSQGMVFNLFEAGSMASVAFEKIILPELPQGLGWNTSLLGTEGKLIVQQGNAHPTIQDNNSAVFTACSFDSQIRLSVSGVDGTSLIRIFNAAGTRIVTTRTTSLPGETKQLLVDVPSSGIYFVRFETARYSETIKVIVQ